MGAVGSARGWRVRTLLLIIAAIAIGLGVGREILIASYRWGWEREQADLEEIRDLHRGNVSVSYVTIGPAWAHWVAGKKREGDFQRVSFLFFTPSPSPRVSGRVSDSFPHCLGAIGD